MLVPGQPVALREAEAEFIDTMSVPRFKEVENGDCFVHSHGNALLTSSGCTLVA